MKSYLVNSWISKRLLTDIHSSHNNSPTSLLITSPKLTPPDLHACSAKSPHKHPIPGCIVFVWVAQHRPSNQKTNTGVSKQNRLRSKNGRCCTPPTPHSENTTLIDNLLEAIIPSPEIEIPYCPITQSMLFSSPPRGKVQSAEGHIVAFI